MKLEFKKILTETILTEADKKDFDVFRAGIVDAAQKAGWECRLENTGFYLIPQTDGKYLSKLEVHYDPKSGYKVNVKRAPNASWVEPFSGDKTLSTEQFVNAISDSIPKALMTGIIGPDDFKTNEAYLTEGNLGRFLNNLKEKAKTVLGEIGNSISNAASDLKDTHDNKKEERKEANEFEHLLKQFDFKKTLSDFLSDTNIRLDYQQHSTDLVVQLKAPYMCGVGVEILNGEPEEGATTLGSQFKINKVLTPLGEPSINNLSIDRTLKIIFNKLQIKYAGLHPGRNTGNGEKKAEKPKTPLIEKLEKKLGPAIMEILNSNEDIATKYDKAFQADIMKRTDLVHYYLLKEAEIDEGKIEILALPEIVKLIKDVGTFNTTNNFAFFVILTRGLNQVVSQNYCKLMYELRDAKFVKDNRKDPNALFYNADFLANNIRSPEDARKKLSLWYNDFSNAFLQRVVDSLYTQDDKGNKVINQDMLEEINNLLATKFDANSIKNIPAIKQAIFDLGNKKFGRDVSAINKLKQNFNSFAGVKNNIDADDDDNAEANKGEKKVSDLKTLNKIPTGDPILSKSDFYAALKKYLNDLDDEDALRNFENGVIGITNPKTNQ